MQPFICTLFTVPCQNSVRHSHYYVSVAWFGLLLIFVYVCVCSLRLFQNFESFRVLVCGGDGSVSWVLNEIDQLGLQKQVHRIAVSF